MRIPASSSQLPKAPGPPVHVSGDERLPIEFVRSREVRHGLDLQHLAIDNHRLALQHGRRGRRFGEAHPGVEPQALRPARLGRATAPASRRPKCPPARHQVRSAGAGAAALLDEMAD